LEHGERVEGARVLDAALEDDVHAEVGPLLEGEHELAIVDDLRRHAAAFELLEEELLLHAHAREEDADGGLTHPSLLRPPARARARPARSRSLRARPRNPGTPRPRPSPRRHRPIRPRRTRGTCSSRASTRPPSADAGTLAEPTPRET